MQSGIERELTGDLPFPGTLVESTRHGGFQRRGTEVRTGQGPVEGASGKRGLFELVRPHEAGRGVQGHRAHLGSDGFPAIVDQRPLSRSHRRAVEAGGARTSSRSRSSCAPRPGRPAMASKPSSRAGAQDDPADADRARRRHSRRRPAGAGARAAPRHADRDRVPPERARLAARPALHVRSFIEGPSNRVAFAAAQGGGGIAVERGALQSAVPACDGRARQDASAAGDRGRIAASRTRSRASSI